MSCLRQSILSYTCSEVGCCTVVLGPLSHVGERVGVTNNSDSITFDYSDDEYIDDTFDNVPANESKRPTLSGSQGQHHKSLVTSTQLVGK